MCTGQFLKGGVSTVLSGGTAPSSASLKSGGIQGASGNRNFTGPVSVAGTRREESRRDVGGAAFSAAELFFQDFGRAGSAAEVAAFDPNTRLGGRRLGSFPGVESQVVGGRLPTGERDRTTKRARSGESAPVPFDINAAFQTGVTAANRTAARGGFRLSTNQLAVRNTAINVV